jgi:capsule polysaccharide export protein KpsE/RkpR
MCDSIIGFLNEKVRLLHRIKHLEVATIAKKDYALISHKVDSLEEKLNVFRTEYQILDYRLQAEEITKGMVRVMSQQGMNTAGGKELSRWLKNLTEKGGEFEILDKEQRKMTSQKDSIMRVYDQSVSSANKRIVYGQLVEKPVPADKKSYPVRSIIVLVSLISALLLALLLILIIENIKRINGAPSKG